MVRVRAHLSERHFLEQVRMAARQTGWLTYHTYSSKRSEPGFPDLVLVHAERKQLLFVELKTEKGTVSQDQWAWLNALTNCGHRAILIRPSDIEWFYRELAGAA